jgi:hypothetical protein
MLVNKNSINHDFPAAHLREQILCDQGIHYSVVFYELESSPRFYLLARKKVSIIHSYHLVATRIKLDIFVKLIRQYISE